MAERPGPSFLWQSEFQPPPQQEWNLADSDPEVRKIKALATGAIENRHSLILDRLKCFSSWHRAKRAIAYCTNFKNRLKQRILNQNAPAEPRTAKQKINVEDLQSAELEIIRIVQEIEFSEEIEVLRSL